MTKIVTEKTGENLTKTYMVRKLAGCLALRGHSVEEILKMVASVGFNNNGKPYTIHACKYWIEQSAAKGDIPESLAKKLFPPRELKPVKTPKVKSEEIETYKRQIATLKANNDFLREENARISKLCGELNVKLATVLLQKPTEIHSAFRVTDHGGANGVMTVVTDEIGSEILSKTNLR